MKTLVIRNGDLALGPGGFQTITGPQKVKQDLAVAMREPFGCDRFHPRWGSLLFDYVGRPVSLELEALIRGEITRLVQNYAASQGEALMQDRTRSQRRSRFSTNEVVSGVEAIQVRQEYDRYHIRVIVRTMAGEEITLTRTVEA